jgi:hypothetical protein
MLIEENRKKRVARLMRTAGLEGVSRRRKRTTTVRDPQARPAEDLIGKCRAPARRGAVIGARQDIHVRVAARSVRARQNQPGDRARPSPGTIAARVNTMRATFTCFAVVLATLAACSPSAQEQDLAEAREQWSRRRARSYEFTWQQDCFCEVEWGRPIRISVDGSGQITSAAYVDDRQAVAEPVRNFLATVDGVFDQIEDAIDEDASEIDVSYDATWGYPASVFVDYDRRTADEELTLHLVDFTIEL